MARRPRKYGNEPVYVDGIRFESKREARRYRDLTLLSRAGEVRNLELQKSFDICIGEFHVCKYRADFTYEERQPDGSWAEVVEDAKGVATPLFRLKQQLMRAGHGIDVKEV